jgi:chromosome segregation ATPase
MATEAYWCGPGTFLHREGHNEINIAIGEKLPAGVSKETLDSLIKNGKASLKAPAASAETVNRAAELEKQLLGAKKTVDNLTAEKEELVGRLQALSGITAERDDLATELEQAQATIKALTEQLTGAPGAGPAAEAKGGKK